MSESSYAAERWLPVPGYEGYYEVSDHGRVRSLPRVVRTRNDREWSIAGRLRRPSQAQDGRRCVHLYRDGRCQTRKIYHLVLEAFVGPMPRGHEARHLNGDHTDDRLANLCWGTHSENQHDQVRHGTHPTGGRTHCVRGHELAPWNLVPSLLTLRNERGCLACHRAKGVRRWARQQGRAIDLQAVADQKYAQVLEERRCRTAPA